jgi:hypothetical protein
VITGLEPNTSYVFSGYTRHKDDTDVTFSVKVGREERTGKSSEVKKGGVWRLVHVRFTADNTGKAVIAITNTGSSPAHVDDTGVVITQYLDQN